MTAKSRLIIVASAIALVLALPFAAEARRPATQSERGKLRAALQQQHAGIGRCVKWKKTPMWRTTVGKRRYSRVGQPVFKSTAACDAVAFNGSTIFHLNSSKVWQYHSDAGSENCADASDPKWMKDLYANLICIRIEGK